MKQKRHLAINFIFITIALSFSILAQKVEDKTNEVEREAKINSISGTENIQAIGDKIIFKDGSTTLMEIHNLPVDGGGIYLPPGGTSSPAFMLHSTPTGELLWNGAQLGLASGGVSAINDLSDALHERSSLYVGEGSGSSDNSPVLHLFNTALGNNALKVLSSGQFNVAIGIEALENNNGHSNTAVGSQSIRNNNSGTDNTALGSFTLNQNTGSRNVALGTNALRSVSSGSGNIAVGYNAGKNETGSNKLYIENSDIATPLIYGEFDNDLVKINGDFHVTGNISVDNDKSISGLDNLIGYNDLKLFGNPGSVDIFISGGGNIGMGENNPADAKLVVKKGTNDFAAKLDGKVIVTDVLEVSGTGIKFNDGDTEDDNIIKKTTKMKYYINVSGGAFPSSSGTNTGTLIGEIKLLPYINVVPGGWLECNGQEVDILTYQSLFSLIGITYGGNGTTTFALPDMRNAVPNHN